MNIALPVPLAIAFVRHAEASPDGRGHSTEDVARPLTERGRRQARRLALALKSLGLGPRFILTSPLVRARQTAAVIRSTFPEAPVEITESLKLGHSKLETFATDLAHYVQRYRPATAKNEADTKSPIMVAAVGHQPDLGYMLQMLLGPDISPGQPQYDPFAAGSTEESVLLRKGSCVVLSFEYMGAPPRILFAADSRVIKRLAQLAVAEENPSDISRL